MTIEEKIKLVIGDLIVKQFVLELEVEKLRAEVDKLKTPSE